MRFVWVCLSVLLIGSIPVISDAQDSYNMAAIAARAIELYNDPSSPSFGDPNGDVTIVEFYDYRCGYCKATEEGFQRLLQEDRRLKIVLKDFPKLGPLSDTAAIVTLASMRQGMDKYYQLHAILMNKDFHLASEDMLFQTAESVGLDVDRLKQDMSDPAIAQQIQNTIALGRSVGVTMTPTFIISGRLFPGAEQYDQLKKIVDYVRATDRGR